MSNSIVAKYGIPYMGSKGSICDALIQIFPSATNFYDLFGGGFSVTHAMLANRAHDFKQFHFNEIRPGVCGLIQDAIAGKYSYEHFKPRWISREEFLERKEIDAYIKLCWSFGNNGKAYIFGKNIEHYKKTMHNAVVFNEFTEEARFWLGIDQFSENMSIKERRMFLRKRAHDIKRDFANLSGFDVQQIQQLEQLERLQQLEQLANVTFYSHSYEQVPIKQDSVIYCDIPYRNTARYCHEFDHAAFFDWADAQTQPVLISEYEITDPRFSIVFSITKRSLLCASKQLTLYKDERVYANKSAMRLLLDSARQLSLF
jgi:site-specific DNA-adenine methylase